MIVCKGNITLDIDAEKTATYAQKHSVCDCDEDRNFCMQAREKLPKLADFLSELGLLIERPDEIGSVAEAGCVHYHFVAYTVTGTILNGEKYETEFLDGDVLISVKIDNSYFPNEQETDRYFSVAVWDFRLPWVLDSPFTETDVRKCRIPWLKRFAYLFHKKH